MIQRALGPSPLEPDIRAVEGILSEDRDVSSAGTRVAAWAEAALRVARADEVRIEKIGPPDSREIVVGEIRGREFPQDYVLMPAPLCQSGATPLASAENVAVLIDAVRVIQTSGNIPRRSIRFVFFSSDGREPSAKLAAVWAYMRQHRADLDHIEAAVSIDAARAALDGYSLGDRPALLPAVREALEPLRSLGIRSFTEGLRIQAPVMPLWLEGIPTLVATAAGGGADLPSGRSALDTIDPMRLQQLKRAVAIAAITAYALADAPERIGPRRSRADVQHSIDSTGIESRLDAAGLRAPWQALQAQQNN